MISRSRLEWSLALGGLVFLGAGIAFGWDEISANFTLSPLGFGVATLSSLLGLLAIAAAWSISHDPGARTRAFRRYLTIQPAKHIPGGLAHPVGLISASSWGSSATESTMRFIRFSVMLLASGLSIGLLLIPDPKTRVIGVAASATGILLGLLLSRNTATLALYGLLTRLFATKRTALPFIKLTPSSRRDSLKAFGLSIMGILGLAFGFASLASSVGGSAGATLLTGAFGVAWAVGYAFVPFPAGLGVREAVLIFLLSGMIPSAGSILAIALAQRLSQILAEGIGATAGYCTEALYQRRARATLS